jgi:hypothetical protein
MRRSYAGVTAIELVAPVTGRTSRRRTSSRISGRPCNRDKGGPRDDCAFVPVWRVLFSRSLNNNNCGSQVVWMFKWPIGAEHQGRAMRAPRPAFFLLGRSIRLDLHFLAGTHGSDEPFRNGPHQSRIGHIGGRSHRFGRKAYDS